MLTVKNKVNKRLIQKLQTDENAPYHGQKNGKDKLFFSSTNSGTPKEFPTLNIVSLGEPSISDDLEHRTQCAIISNIELKAYTNTNVTSAFDLMDYAGDIMLDIGYSLVGDSPQDISDSTANIVVARFRRIVGAGDKLY